MNTDHPPRSPSGGQPHRVPEPPSPKPIPGVRHIVAVASGKGGVGKSTIATNLAAGLRRLGHAVGLLDADIYGPSLPKMMDVDRAPDLEEDGTVRPVEAHGVRCVSIGLMVPDQQAVIWRGPMVANFVKMFLEQVDWGELDYLVIDLPPGTGDAQLTMVQSVPLSGAVIVTTPQEVALTVARRGIAMFRRLDVPVLGVVETMSWYALPDGSRDYVFGEGGGQRIALTHDTTLLAQLPLLTAVRRACDDGLPMVLQDEPEAEAYLELARAVAAHLPVG